MNQKYNLLLTLILVSFLLVPILAIYPNYGLLNEASARLYLVSFAATLGLLGTVLIWWQVVLGFRGLIGRWFTDTVWLNRIHQIMGKYGYVLVFAHPLLIFIGYNAPISFWLPDPTQPFKLFVSMGSISFLVLLIVWVSSALLRGRIGYRWWKRLHLASYFVLPLIIVHGFNIGSLLSQSQALKGYWMMLGISFLLLTLWRIAFQLGIGRARYKLVNKQLVGTATYKYDFAPIMPGNQAIKPFPGQYIYIQITRWGEAHPFTVSHYNPQSGQLSISVKASGPFSKIMTGLQEGVEVYLDGAYGVFTKELYTEENPKPTIIIAGGIGITPFIANLSVIQQTDSPVLIIYANRTPQDVAFRQEIDGLLDYSKNVVHVYSNLSTDTAEYTLQPNEFVGFVDAELLKTKLGLNLLEYRYFICGPKVMMDKLKLLLTAEGVSKLDIHTEEFSL